MQDSQQSTTEEHMQHSMGRLLDLLEEWKKEWMNLERAVTIYVADKTHDAEKRALIEAEMDCFSDEVSQAVMFVDIGGWLRDNTGKSQGFPPPRVPRLDPSQIPMITLLPDGEVRPV